MFNHSNDTIINPRNDTNNTAQLNNIVIDLGQEYKFSRLFSQAPAESVGRLRSSDPPPPLLWVPFGYYNKYILLLFFQF